MIGTDGIRFAIEWIDEQDGERFDTLAVVRIDLDGQPIWPVWGDATTDLDVFADDILAFLTENWKKLLLEQHYPGSLQPNGPSQLSALAEEVAEDKPRVIADTLHSSVVSFENAHNLARAIAGQFELPSLWMIRQGDCMIIETGGRTVRIAADAWIAKTSEFGEAIASRLRMRLPDKYGRLLAAWDARNEGDPISILSVSGASDRCSRRGGTYA
ncbi:MAG: hypothetical protein K5821_15365 [Nitrobacter sp.]|uniref:hypothetical protein n=1 Tax=Nitrobacter sp. TaxID=29420 RepID=UPI002633B0B8|nr:hypothetical protein [Nitrobacter sp.]MCV0387763.1 hypothetical protein [Nitrobacter sp.]